MSKFIQLIQEAVPNRSQGEIFKSFYKGKVGATKKDNEQIKLALSDVDRFSNIPLETMRDMHLTGKIRLKSKKTTTSFPNFTGKKKKQEVNFGDTDYLGSVDALDFMFSGDKHPQRVTVNPSLIGFESKLPKSNIDRYDLHNTLAHELTHTTQHRLIRRGLRKYGPLIVPQLYTLASSGVDGIKNIEKYYTKRQKAKKPNYSVPRTYTDAIGNVRKTDDQKYAVHLIKGLAKSQREVKRAKSRGFLPFSAGHSAYQRNPMEQEARIIGSIAKTAAELSHDRTKSFPSLSQFVKSTEMGKKPSKSLQKKVRKTYGRMAMAFQDVSGRKVNPQNQDRDHLMRFRPINELGETPAGRNFLSDYIRARSQENMLRGVSQKLTAKDEHERMFNITQNPQSLFSAALLKHLAQRSVHKYGRSRKYVSQAKKIIDNQFRL